jgi:hypothetical protein
VVLGLASGVQPPTTLSFSQTSDWTFTWIGGFDISRQGRKTDLSFSYNRTTRPSTAQSTSVDVDLLRLRYKRRLSQWIGSELSTSWVQQKSATSLDDVTTKIFEAAASLNWRFEEHWRTFVQVAYRDQRASGQLNSANSFDRYTVNVGVQYDLPVDVFGTGGPHARRGK